MRVVIWWATVWPIMLNGTPSAPPIAPTSTALIVALGSQWSRVPLANWIAWVSTSSATWNPIPISSASANCRISRPQKLCSRNRTMTNRPASQTMLWPPVQNAHAMAQAIWAISRMSSSIEMILTYSTWVDASLRNFLSSRN